MLKVAYELFASCLTLSGQLVGSTGPTGSILFAVAQVAWIGWMLRYRQWGFAPINAAGSVICAWNLWAALL